MSAYAIAELKETESGGYSPRGAAKQLWQSRDFETMVSGPAETGKTWGCCQYLDALLWKYPGCQGVMIRKTYSSLIGSVLRTYQRVIGEKSPIEAYGGEKPEWFDYPNGSRLWVAGLDNAQKALSSERDFFYVNQAEEITLQEWAILLTRCTGRGAVMPYTRAFGDCNPGPPSHWIINRPTLKVLESRHEDNPVLFDEQGTLTEQGGRSLAVLDTLPGVLYDRLRLGKWMQSEGAVYQDFDKSLHLIDRNDPKYGLENGIPDEWPRYRVIDFGYTNPFVCQWWAQDPDGRLFRYREIYHTKRIVEDHARQIVALSEGEKIVQTICDHDREDNETLKRHGIPNVNAYKDVERGIQAVQQRLKKAGDGKPRLFLLRDSLVEIDRDLQEARKPICTEQEFEVYVFAKGVDGKPNKEEPVKEFDHGMDASRYLVARFDCSTKRIIRAH